MAVQEDFYPLKVRSVHREPGDGLIVTFDIPSATAETFRFKPGQFIAVRATIDGEVVRRSYSIAAAPDEPLRIGIKHVEGGQFSGFAHRTLKPGAMLEVMPPQGRFVLTPSDGTPRHVIAIAAGSGITPVLGIARQALLQEPATRFTLIYGSRARDAILFGEELEGLKDRHLGRFDYIPMFSRAGEVDAPLFEGRIDAAKIKALAATLVPFKDAKRIFLCGPGDLIKTCRTALFELGVDRDVVAHEFFAGRSGGERPRATDPEIAVAHEAATAGRPVTVVLDGARHRLKVADGETVLQAALKAGVKAPYACAGGMCSTCRAKIVTGHARMLLNYSLEPWEIERGFTLACQAVPTGNDLVLDWDAM